MMSCISCVEKINDLSFFLSLLIGSRLECPMVYVDSLLDCSVHRGNWLHCDTCTVTFLAEKEENATLVFFSLFPDLRIDVRLL